MSEKTYSELKVVIAKANRDLLNIKIDDMEKNIEGRPAFNIQDGGTLRADEKLVNGVSGASEISEILAGIGVTVKQALKNFDANMKALNALAAEPELIQGYTAEEWQEIINGGYLCEFSIDDNFKGVFGTLDKDGIIGLNRPFIKRTSNTVWAFCRPAQLKGVMRPIFVEPVDDGAKCAFFNSQGLYLFRAIWKNRFGVGELLINVATKYIEV